MICIENSYYPCTEITYNLASTCSKPHRERQCIAHLVEIVDWRVRNVGDVTEEPALYDRHVGPQQTHQQGGQHDFLTQVMLFAKGRHEVQDTFRFNVCMFSRVGWFSRKNGHSASCDKLFKDRNSKISLWNVAILLGAGHSKFWLLP